MWLISRLAWRVPLGFIEARMLSQVELGRPRGEVFPGYREAALPSSHQEGGVLWRPGLGLAVPGA